MSQDELETVVEDGIQGLRRYIRLLESLLASARAAENLFRVGYHPVEGVDPGGREVPSLSHALGFGSGAGPAQAISDHDEEYRLLEAALLAEMPRGHNRVLRGLRVIAAANGGELDFGQACKLMTNVGICRGTAANVSSYISRRLRLSDEFERVGEPGSGRYKWLPYQGEGMEGAPDPVAYDCGSSGSEEAVGDS